MPELKPLPKISVIISSFTQMECSPARRRPFFAPTPPLKECIESIKKQDYHNIEIIVPEYKPSSAPWHLRNAAADKARGDILFFLCPLTIIVDEKGFSQLVQVFHETNADVVVGTGVAHSSSPFFIQLLLKEIEVRESRNMDEGYVDAGSFCYFAIKRPTLEDVGYFSADKYGKEAADVFLKSGLVEDWHFCGCLREKGYKVWHTNKVKVYHRWQTDFPGYFKRQFLAGWYRTFYMLKFRKIREGYTTYKIAFQPVMVFSLPVWGLMAMLFGEGWLYLLYVTSLAIFFWETDILLLLYRKKKCTGFRYLLLLPISFIRSFVWAAGLLKGFWDFVLMKKRGSSA